MEKQSAQYVQAPTGVILKVEHRPHTVEGEINTHINLKGHPLPAPHRNQAIHHTISPELTWHSQYCIYCQQCQTVCPRGCLHQAEDGLNIDHENCNTCGTCVKECPSLALEIIGKQTTAADLLHKIFKQNYPLARKIKHVTIGGGEPGLQTAFCADLLFQLSAMGISTTLKTTGTVPFEHYLPLIPFPAFIHFELITTDPVHHKQITGCGNDSILENLTLFTKEITPTAQIVIRTPLLRGQNTSPKLLHQTSTWLKAHFPSPPPWELFEPHSDCEAFIPFTVDEFKTIFASLTSHYPAHRIRLFN